MAELPDSVSIREVGPRDGLQNEKSVVPVEVKAEFVRRLLAAYDDVYGVAGDAFRPAQAAVLDDLFDMQHYFDDVVAGLPFPAAAMLEPAFLDAVTTDAEHPLRVRLRENAVDQWTPQAPLRLYVSPQDE